MQLCHLRDRLEHRVGRLALHALRLRRAPWLPVPHRHPNGQHRKHSHDDDDSDGGLGWSVRLDRRQGLGQWAAGASHHGVLGQALVTSWPRVASPTVALAGPRLAVTGASASGATLLLGDVGDIAQAGVQWAIVEAASRGWVPHVSDAAALTRLAHTSKTTIALVFLVINLEKALALGLGPFYFLFFLLLSKFKDRKILLESRPEGTSAGFLRWFCGLVPKSTQSLKPALAA